MDTCCSIVVRNVVLDVTMCFGVLKVVLTNLTTAKIDRCQVKIIHQ